MQINLLTDGIYPLQIGGMQKRPYYLVDFLARRGEGEYSRPTSGERVPYPFRLKRSPIF